MRLITSMTKLVTVVATFMTGSFAEDLLFVNSLIGFSSLEQVEAEALGFTAKFVSEEHWRALGTKDFASYKAIIINDPAVGFDPTDIGFLSDTAQVWGPAIKGNIIIHGTDQSNHGAETLISNSISFAAAAKSSSGSHQTGLYLSLSQYYNTYDSSEVPALSYFGNFTVRGNLDCYNAAHIVASSPAISNLTDDQLSNWGCSVHEAFSSFPSVGLDGFQALAIADGVTGEGTRHFANGKFGLPYIISRGATPAGCGDGHWDKSIGEECDDGNTDDDDGCSRSCKCESGRPKGDGTCYQSAGSAQGEVRSLKHSTRENTSLPSIFALPSQSSSKLFGGIVLASTRMIEPFHQLHKQGGASAKEALLSDYLSSGLSLESLKNIFRRHWVMTLTIGVYFVSTISMAVASESMTLRSGNNCTTPDDPLRCDLQWVINVKIVRALQTFMALSTTMIFLRTILGWNRASGVSSYPCSIASMATLLSNPVVQNTFIRIEPEATRRDMATALSNNHYMLGRYETSTGDVGYGLTQIPIQQEQNWWQNLRARFAALVPIPERRSKLRRDRVVTWEGSLHALFLFVHLTLFGIFLYYRLSHNPSLFVNKTRFGPRFFLTIATTLLSLQWGRLEGEVRIMTPYRRLSKPNAGSRHLIDMSLHGVPLTTFLHAVWYGNFFHALVALVAILSDVLIIAVVGIPYNFGVIQDISFFSSTTCLGILGLMIITALLIIWWRWTNPAMPRKPDTLANVMMMLCASRMLEQFAGLGGQAGGPVQTRDLEARTSGRQYRFGKQFGVDEKERAMVEVVEVENEPAVELSGK